MSRVRDHWSIGEVLSLLQDEFPEVTISKIRFLESQGLIDPERTSSGYRKFSDGDYDRLYWILEQQRDHYLPLRVIRDRLEEGQEIEPAPRRSDSRIGESLPDEDYDDQAMEDHDDSRAEDELAEENGVQEDAADSTKEDHSASADDSGSADDSDSADEVDDSAADPDSAGELDAGEGSSADEGFNEALQKADAATSADQRDTMFRDALAENEGPIVPPGPSEAHPIRTSGENSFSDALTEAARLRAAMSRPGANGPLKADEVAAAPPRMGDQETPWASTDSSESETETLVLSDDVFEAVVVSVPATQGGDGADSRLGRRTPEAPVRREVANRASNPEQRTEVPIRKGDERAPARSASSTRPAAPATPTTPANSTTSAAPISEENMSEAGDRTPAPRLLGTRTEGPKPTTKSTAEVLAPPPRPTLPGSSVALDRDELAEQSGCTPGMIDELEKHGMISPRNVAGTILFDSTALTLARLAVQFGRYGLEPRHLRTFRLSAEREVALLTQSIGPTLRANNAETRRRSFDTLQDLAELAASLRSIIVRDLVADLEPGG